MNTLTETVPIEPLDVPPVQVKPTAGNRLKALPGGAALLIVLGVLVVAPIGYLIYGSFRSAAPGLRSDWTLANFGFLASPEFLGYLRDTVLLAIGGTIIGFVIALGLAVAILRVRIPGARLLDSLVVLPAYVPAVLIAFAWIMMLSPQVGFLNAWFGDLGLPTVDIYSLPGIVWVMGLAHVPMAYLYLKPALLAVDSSLEEAAWTVGASKFQTMRKIVLKVAAPGLLSAALIVFVNCLGEFTIPATLGPTSHIATISSQLLVFVSEFPGNPNKAAVMGLFLMTLSVLGLLLNRRLLKGRVYATVGARGSSQSPGSSSRMVKILASVGCGLYLLFAVVIPAFALIVGSLKAYPSPDFSAPWTFANYQDLITFPGAVGAVINSLVLSVAAAIIAMLISVAIARTYLRNPRFGKVLDQIGSLTIAIPHIVFGLALLWMWIVLRVGVYGSSWILLLAYVALFLPLAIRATVDAVAQLDTSMEEAARVAGASEAKVTRSIVLPNIIPSLLSGGTVVIYHVMRELSASLILFTSGSMVLSVVFWQLFQGGRVSPAMAVGIINMVMIFVVVALANLALRIVVGRKMKTRTK